MQQSFRQIILECNHKKYIHDKEYIKIGGVFVILDQYDEEQHYIRMGDGEHCLKIDFDEVIPFNILDSNDIVCVLDQDLNVIKKKGN